MTKVKTIIEYIPDFLDYCEVEKGLSNNTLTSYKQNLRLFTLWLETTGKAHILPAELTKDHVWNYRLYLARTYKTNERKHLSKKSQNYYLITLRALLDYFADRDIETIPSSKIKLAKQSNTETISYMDSAEIERILQVPDTTTIIGLRNRAIMELLFSSGMRVSELVSLNVNQLANEISIIGKGNHIRTIFISPNAMAWVKKYLSERKDTHEALFINHSVMRNENGNRLTTRMIQKMIVTCAKTAGIEKKITPHKFRHSYATNLLSNGADLRSVQELLGHKNVATTQIYTHVTNKGLRDTFNKFHG